MADRFWVGGAGTWNTSSTTNWSATSGGASGASVPTVADSVFFDQAGTYTVTLTGTTLVCLDWTVSAGTVTFVPTTGNSGMTVNGNLNWIAGTNTSLTSFSGQFRFDGSGTKTINLNGASIFGNATNFISGTYNFDSSANFGNITLSGGAVINTNGYAISTGGFFGFGTINLSNSTVIYSGVSGFLNQATLTLNAGTSQINFTGTGSPTCNITAANVGARTFYNVSLLQTSTTGATTIAISDAHTFNNLLITAIPAASVKTVSISAQQTINGTLSTTGTAGNRRVFFTTANYGISQDLVVNSAPSLTDADFRGLYVRGTAAPISGTRIGNRGECRGITFDAPKTVFCRTVGGAIQWTDNAWAATSGGSVNTDNFPLAQDTAIFDNTTPATGISISSTTLQYIPTFDMSLRTTAFSATMNNPAPIYGNWINGSGTTISGTSTLTFSGGTTQTITSAGKTFSCPITVDTYGGTVQLADAFDMTQRTLTVTNGTFNTAGYAVTAGILVSSNSNVRTINLGASTVNLISVSQVIFTTSTNLTFSAGTSQINLSSTSSIPFAGGGQTFYNVSFTGSTPVTHSISGANTFNNLTYTASASAGLMGCSFAANQTINGTLTCAGASAVRRIFLRSGTIGTPSTLTVNSISAADCDFRDITLAGTASGASPTRAGDCGGNTGITFPAPKTVYWNLAGAQSWSSTGWCPSSGGTPDINQFPLAQDTAVFDNGAVSLVTINAAWNIGTFNASAQTNTMTLTTSTNAPVVYGNWLFGSVITSTSSTGTITFAKNGTQTITSNGVQFGCGVTIAHPLANVQLADALSLGSTRTLTLTAGTFDAVTYNVTTGLFTNNATTNTLRMGSGTWTLSGTGSVWNLVALTLIVGTSTIVLSDTSTAARTFVGVGRYYNKLTIGGTTGTSTVTILGSNTFGELASTKTVAHTIAFEIFTTQTIGKWAVTGTVGNLVSVNSQTSANTFTLSIAGPANSGIDYLSVRDCTVATTSPGEFYVGANSTNVSGNTRVIFTATPAPRTLYWVGGTGNWSSTTKWDTTSGGGGGAAIPTSLDAVNFDALSNATAYTATIDAGVTLARCASFTMAGPLTGNVTFAGSVGIAFHGNVTFAATGITRTYTGTMNLAGNASYTFTTNGLTLNSATIFVNGVGAIWTLGSALNNSSGQLTVTYGTFDTSSASSYSVNMGLLFSSNSNIRVLNLNASSVLLVTGQPTITFDVITNFSFNSGTSTITMSSLSSGLTSGGLTFYNVSFTPTAASSIPITGANTFNTLSFAGRTSVGITPVTFNANQTIGTLTLGAGTASAYRTFLASDTIGTQRTLNVTTLTAGAADIDFRDIAITGAAAPLTGTRFGDAKGNSGITFDAAKTVYYRQFDSALNWGGSTALWSATNGGTADLTQFPLAQDTAIFPSSPTPYPNSGKTVTVNASYNIGTIDMSARTTNTMTLATGTNTPQIYGNWINGTGTTLSGTGTMTFAGRGTQQITSAGKTFTQSFTINTPSGSVTLQDAYATSAGATPLTVTAGTFDAGIYSVTALGGLSSSNTNIRTVAVGSGTWTIGTFPNAWTATTSTNLTITGTGTLSLTSASAKTFAGGGANYSGITLNQGGAGTLTITGNNTFKDITNTYSATGATTIALGNTTQTLTNPWTATGAASRVLTVTGTSAASPGILRFSGGGIAANVDYLNISNVRAYDIFDEWYAGANSTNSGSLGWYFQSGIAPTSSIYYGAINVTQIYYGSTPVTAIYYGATQVF